jgi:hypothetical protein
MHAMEHHRVSGKISKSLRLCLYKNVHLQVFWSYNRGGERISVFWGLFDAPWPQEIEICIINNPRNMECFGLQEKEI